jgi:hypothetical protein
MSRTSLRMSSAQRTALYWADLDRHYRGTRAECDAGRYICPRCRVEESVLRLVSYKRTEGKNHRLLSCPNCHFLIKPANIIGHPAYDAASEATMKSASRTVTVTTLTLQPSTPSSIWGDPQVLRVIERSLQYMRLRGVEFTGLSRVPRGLEIVFDLQDVDSDTLASRVIEYLDKNLPREEHFALFGSQSYMLVDYRIDDLGEEYRYASRTYPTASTDTVVARVTVQIAEDFTGLFREEVTEILEDYNNSPHEYLKYAVKTLPKTVFTRMNVEKIAYHRTGRRSGAIVLDIRVEDDPDILDRLEDDVLDALALERTPFAVRYFVFGTPDTHNGWRAKVQLEVL